MVSDFLKAAMLETAPVAIIAHSWQGHVVCHNETATRLLGHPPEELDLGPWGWVGPGERGELDGRLAAIRALGELAFECEGQMSDGSRFPALVRVRVIPSEPELLVTVIERNPHADGEAARIEYLAFHDKLTTLANRTLFEERLAAALGETAESGTRVGVIYLDLDDFKPVNDMHGHACGDEVLKVIARRMERCVRDVDLVSRLGGDEFAILIRGLQEPEQLAIAGQNIPVAVEQPIQLPSCSIRVSVSVGLAVHMLGERPEDLLARADHAMYRAKRSGLPGWREFLREMQACA